MTVVFFLRLSLLARGKHITNQRRRLALCLQEVAKSKKNYKKQKNFTFDIDIGICKLIY